ncbi:MAG: DNA-3-methyladenine glycosylase [Verrucomicrobiota bacterium]|nr:DNA-3-methyladenine glycosylase [Verrucomicrobiota bacterium]
MGADMIRAPFFERDPLLCARELIGMTLVWGRCFGRVVECEAYLTLEDEACHTFTRAGTRAFVDRNQPGAIYIYLNYGVHWMLNVLVKGGARSGLILIRAIEPQGGIRLMEKRRGLNDQRRLCSGPGKLTQALAITDRDHERNICTSRQRCFLEAEHPVEAVADTRIGITRSADFPWRFTLRDSPFVSRAVKEIR